MRAAISHEQAAEAADLAAAATAAEVEAELNQLQERLPQALEAIQRARRCARQLFFPVLLTANMLAAKGS